MTTLPWLPPLVRALTTALLVVTASAAAEAAGPFWGALIASLPVSAGPAYVFLAMQHDAEFVAASALSGVVANAATGAFLIVYGRVAGGMSASRGLGFAVLAWSASALAVQGVAWEPLTALLLNLAVYGVGFRLLGIGRSVHSPAPSPSRRRRFDLLVRAAAVAAFVTLVVAASTMLGSAITGIAAAFPVSLISLIAVVRPRIGGPASSLLAANALRSMLGFGMMLMTVHLTIRGWGTVPAYAAALLVMAAWSSAMMVLRRRQVVG